MSGKLGKISHHLFDHFIATKCGHSREEVRVKPQFGVDVAIIDLPGEMAMAVTSDPLSLIPTLGLEESAWLSVHLMTNDMATTGFAPMYGQFVLNLPAQFSKNDFNLYWHYIHKFCAKIGTAITGGHTGFIEGQNSTIAGGGTFFTVAPKVKLFSSTLAQPGDVILVTKSCAISSAAILTMSFPETVSNKIGTEAYHLACESFYQTSSLNDALLAVGTDETRGGVTAMHDVTEGGVLGAIYELATASGNGAIIHQEKLPIGKLQQDVCSIFSLDPRHCIGAGSMVITCQANHADDIIRRMKSEGIMCCEVGVITEKNHGVKIMEDGQLQDMVYHEEDPYWAAFFKALQAGWK